MFLKDSSSQKSASSSVLGALEEVFNPMAARMRQEWEQRNEQAIPIPTPGERMLRDGRIRIVISEENTSL